METAALTRGSIPPQLVSLALPLIFGNILQQLYNTIDAMVIGRFAGETAFAAIGVAGTVMNLFLFLLSGGSHLCGVYCHTGQLCHKQVPLPV